MEGWGTTKTCRLNIDVFGYLDLTGSSTKLLVLKVNRILKPRCDNRQSGFSFDLPPVGADLVVGKAFRINLNTLKMTTVSLTTWL
ncbi:hypothetical protein O9929_18640 [Vibrio lentus]|nr:hypothetical protein [Vibrio lentus]